ncbi:type II toxin-antitoxin system HipA family toxin [Opitutus sp. ER46]|uniref:type II toxin-antitoxin system HipA family toxin n=1 Tax=Opitutus sp. ER46 TaxID=2161864 RepID=UPI000D31C390|nr:type II toxin-antitoxin system HipA family toxin [Opitutus sp. ER46]PTX94202.1 hypothetical protein DB354_10570 [Opitutus sp. ER46]
MKARNREEVEVLLEADFLGAAFRVGTLFHAAAHGREIFSFAYERSWLDRGDAFAIDPDLQLHAGESYAANDTGVFRIFLDSAPDRWGRLLLDRREVLRAREAKRPVRTLGEWDYLLGVHDSCRMGALRFRTGPDQPFLDDDDGLAAPPLASLRELEAASLALEAPGAPERKEFSRWLMALLAPGSSLGGARPKANFTHRDGSLWIAKFPSRDDRRDMGAWELLVHELAVAAGVDVARAELLSLSGRHRTFATRRFDRVSGGRRFFVSAMTLLGRTDGQGGSYLDLAEFLTTRGSVRHRADDLRQLWTRVAFSVCAGNTDDHLRNHGFILEADGWRLAPAYDLNANPERRLHTLAIDERDPTPDPAIVLATAPYYGLKPQVADGIMAKVRGAVAQWRDVARRLRIPRDEIELLAPAFAERR